MPGGGGGGHHGGWDVGAGGVGDVLRACPGGRRAEVHAGGRGPGDEDGVRGGGGAGRTLDVCLPFV